MNIDFEEVVDPTASTVPLILNDKNQIIQKGLPPKKTLIQITQSLRNEGTS